MNTAIVLGVAAVAVLVWLAIRRLLARIGKAIEAEVRPTVAPPPAPSSPRGPHES